MTDWKDKATYMSVPEEERQYTQMEEIRGTKKAIEDLANKIETFNGNYAKSSKQATWISVGAMLVALASLLWEMFFKSHI